jgi:hypothetical protein
MRRKAVSGCGISFLIPRNFYRHPRGSQGSNECSVLVKDAGREIDLSILQFLRRALGNVPIHPQGEPFDLSPILRKFTKVLHPTGCGFAPDRIIARKRDDVSTPTARFESVCGWSRRRCAVGLRERGGHEQPKDDEKVFGWHAVYCGGREVRRLLFRLSSEDVESRSALGAIADWGVRENECRARSDERSGIA